MQHAQHTLGCTHGPTDPCALALQVEEDLRARLLHLRTDVSATGVLNELHLTEKTAKRLVERFPEDAHLKSQELETFSRASPALLQAWEPSYTLLVQLAEFRQESLKLLSEMSRELVKLSMDLNPAVLREYFNFTLAYAKLHLLLGACLQDQSNQGRLVLAAYCQAHRTAGKGEPAGVAQLAAYVREFEAVLPRLQADLGGARIRFAEALLPQHEPLALPLPLPLPLPCSYPSPSPSASAPPYP